MDNNNSSNEESVVSLDEEIGHNDLVTGAPTASLSTVSGAGVVGEVDGTDVRFPRFQIVQGVGPLSEKKEFSKGDLVLDGECQLSYNDQPISITVCQIGKQYEENIPYDSDDIPRIVNTKAEVLQLNGTTEGSKEGGKWVPPSWRAIADALICIEAPKDMPEEIAEVNFPFEAPSEPGKKFAFARWVIKGVAYKSAAVEIFSAASMYYRDGLKKGTFILNTQKRMFGPNSVYVPTIRKGTRNSPEFSSWLSEFA